MVSRRRFLQLGTAMASTTLATRSLAQQDSGEKSAPLPPSIASLKSMKDQAKPITRCASGRSGS